MREAIGGSWLFGLVITFIVFFASFLAVSINYSKAFNIKNNIVDIIGKYEGNNCAARERIGDYLYQTGYIVTRACPSVNGDPDYYTGYLESGDRATGDDALYCVHKEEVVGTNLNKIYYSVIIFFRIDLPVVGRLTTFPIKGETESIYFATDLTDGDCP